MFIVLEGIDGAGGGTQRKALEQYFSTLSAPTRSRQALALAGRQRSALKFDNVLTLKYPYYETPIGKMIKEFLYSDTKLPPEKQFLLFFSQWAFESPKIESARKNGLVIADRWMTSGIVYQGIQGISANDLLEANRIFKLSIPDAFIFLDVPANIAASRDMKGKEGKENRFEEKKDFLARCYAEYKKLMEKQVIAPWIRVDGTKPIPEVTKELIGIIQKLYGNAKK